ncbi:tRNA (adenosine(37)-N6)-threonylcarbamoyltransferase complex ATPase subunit type 1 TsaE [Olleya aquimaris]|uniref:tRNA threonylcarbamoyladenosine biosynthesis protein TsaE n=1 Tax=Olleya sediminilitoris TaxID=2795739 RepID=A0ABS1WME3_9FLAO|nr:tRNA (adenosine(37)-N6)-threonylcarbamoyltransferase complex ATPase subunit type 1 TsaE [Olleya sediminilitoris]AXO79152.1 tRNA (adenosine(37)-N6)-threonylcarbamoyltransferase complex ATPase subunit type 1 TsaE [Olleya aquimaris]MBL7560297.1 tRNA (adenosine(37)-N6)-threonylcarbamoyltransferase complex ATPase subunit type 1 TsaE [Olleya sediminilitoris]
MELNYNLEDVEAIAKQILETTTSKTILFEGEMGVGKTTLIKTLVKLLGSIDNVSSPTFSLVNEYKGQNDTIYHFDLYRIEDETELYDFGIDTYLYSNNYVLVEWPDLLKPLIQDNYSIIRIKLSENSTRNLTIENFS